MAHDWRRIPPQDKKTSRSTTITAVFLEQDAAPTDIGFGGSLKNPVKPIEESSQQAVALFARSKKQCGQSRAERKRVERGENYRDGDSDCELLIQPAGDSGNKGSGHEYRRENQGNSYYGTRQFLHRLQCGILWCHALFDMPLHALDDDDRVIYHQADRQHQPEQRECVDGKTEQRK